MTKKKREAEMFIECAKCHANSFPIRTIRGKENESFTREFVPGVGNNFVCDSARTFNRQLIILMNENPKIKEKEARLANVKMAYELIVANLNFVPAITLYTALKKLREPDFVKKAPFLYQRYGAILDNKLEELIRWRF